MLFFYKFIHLLLKYSSKQFTNSFIFSILFTFSLILLESFKFFMYQQICFLISLIATYSPFSLIAKSRCSLIILNFCTLLISSFFSLFNSFIKLCINQGFPKVCSSYHYSIHACIFKHFYCIFSTFYISISYYWNPYTFFYTFYNF